MALFDWLFRRRPAEIGDPPENPRGHQRRITYPARNHSTPQPTTTQPTTPPKEPAAGDIFDLDYSAGGGQEALRRVTFLFSVPGEMVKAIDLGKRRVRTYRIDRMKRIIRPADQKTYDPKAFFSTCRIVDTLGWCPEQEDLTVAAQMRSQMVCQLSLLVLMATADGPITADRLDRIMAYARRENRFATRDGWVPTGDKRGVWPILRDMVHQLQPTLDQIDIFIGTLTDDWENQRRFDALNEALSDLANFGGTPTAAARAIGDRINRIAGRPR